MPQQKSKARGTKETQEAMRFKVMAAVKGGMTMLEASRIFMVSYSAVRQWRKISEKNGTRALKARKRGRKKGDGKKLGMKQEEKLRTSIANKNPDQLELPFVLWERKAVQALCERRFAIKVPLSTIGLYLKNWGMTRQRPTKCFKERQDGAAKQWVKRVYPEIRRRAKRQNAEIQWADESGASNRSGSAAKGYAPKGRTPVLKESAVKRRINHISSVTNQGKVRYMTYRGKFDSKVFIRFLERSIRGRSRKIMMIVDNYRVHKSAVVLEWLKIRRKRIEIEYLPPYCPDPNPDEYLNCDVKSNVHREKLP